MTADPNAPEREGPLVKGTLTDGEFWAGVPQAIEENLIHDDGSRLPLAHQLGLAELFEDGQRSSIGHKLMKLGVHMNAVDLDGKTALHFFLDHLHYGPLLWDPNDFQAAAKVLMQDWGLSLSDRDFQGRTPLDILESSFLEINNPGDGYLSHDASSEEKDHVRQNSRQVIENIEHQSISLRREQKAKGMIALAQVSQSEPEKVHDRRRQRP